ncbi:hypothetical protein HK099_005537, partial [Clydaea vesicula]
MIKELQTFDSETIKFVPLQIDAKLKVSDPLATTASVNLLAASNIYGYIVAASDSGFKFYNTKNLVHSFKISENKKVNYESEVVVNIKNSKISHLRLSADEKKIIIGTNKNEILVFEAGSVEISKGNLEPSKTILFSKPSTFTDLKPNPDQFPNLCTILFDDGSVLNVDVTDGKIIESKLNEKISSICWSKQGKRLACATVTGDIIQFTPEFEEKKRIAPPPSFIEEFGSEVSIKSLTWIENKTFLAYFLKNDDSEYDSATLYCIDQVGNEISYQKFVDPPLFSRQNEAGINYYYEYIPSWGKQSKYFVIYGEAGSTDIGFIQASENPATPNNYTWATVTLSDYVTLPLKEDDTETRIVGFALDFTSKEETRQLNIPDPIPPSPILLILLDDGNLVGYHCFDTALQESTNAMTTIKPLEVEHNFVRSNNPPSVISNNSTSFVSNSFGITEGKNNDSSVLDTTTKIKEQNSGFSSFGSFNLNSKKENNEKTSPPKSPFGSFTASKPSDSNSTFGFSALKEPSKSNTGLFNSTPFKAASAFSDAAQTPSASGIFGSKFSSFGSNLGGKESENESSEESFQFGSSTGNNVIEKFNNNEAGMKKSGAGSLFGQSPAATSSDGKSSFTEHVERPGKNPATPSIFNLDKKVTPLKIEKNIFSSSISTSPTVTNTPTSAVFNATAETDPSFQSSKGTKLLVDNFDLMYREFEQDREAFNDLMRDSLNKWAEDVKSRFTENTDTMKLLSTSDWGFNDLNLLLILREDLSDLVKKAQSDFVKIGESFDKINNNFYSTKRKVLECRNYLEQIENNKKIEENRKGKQYFSLPPEAEELELAVKVVSDYIQGKIKNENQLSGPVLHKISTSITRLFAFSQEITARLNEINDMLKNNVDKPNEIKAALNKKKKKKKGYGLFDSEDEENAVAEITEDVSELCLPKSDGLEFEKRHKKLEMLKSYYDNPSRTVFENKKLVVKPKTNWIRALEEDVEDVINESIVIENEVADKKDEVDKSIGSKGTSIPAPPTLPLVADSLVSSIFSSASPMIKVNIDSPVGTPVESPSLSLFDSPFSKISFKKSNLAETSAPTTTSGFNFESKGWNCKKCFFNNKDGTQCKSCKTTHDFQLGNNNGVTKAFTSASNFGAKSSFNDGESSKSKPFTFADLGFKQSGWNCTICLSTNQENINCCLACETDRFPVAVNKAETKSPQKKTFTFGSSTSVATSWTFGAKTDPNTKSPFGLKTDSDTKSPFGLKTDSDTKSPFGANGASIDTKFNFGENANIGEKPQECTEQVLSSAVNHMASDQSPQKTEGTVEQGIFEDDSVVVDSEDAPSNPEQGDKVNYEGDEVDVSGVMVSGADGSNTDVSDLSYNLVKSSEDESPVNSVLHGDDELRDSISAIQLSPTKPGSLTKEIIDNSVLDKTEKLEDASPTKPASSVKVQESAFIVNETDSLNSLFNTSTSLGDKCEIDSDKTESSLKASPLAKTNEGVVFGTPLKTEKGLSSKESDIPTKSISTAPVFGSSSFGKQPSPSLLSNLSVSKPNDGGADTPSLFGVSATSPFTTQPKNTTSVFGTIPSTVTTLPFGAGVASTASPFSAQAPPASSPFGAVSATTASPTSAFGMQPQANSLFGAQSTIAPSAFGIQPQVTSAFGAQSTTAPSAFGIQPQATSLFGAQSTTAPSAFGVQPKATSLFGAQSTTAPSAFGIQPQATSAFGAQSTTAPSAFGIQPQVTPTFGAQPGFGNQPQTAFSAFGANSTSTPSTSVFGSSNLNSNALPSAFGSGLNSSPAFGSVQNNSSFQSAPAFGSSSFGGVTPAFSSNSFGAPAYGSSSFGSQPAASGFGSLNNGNLASNFGASFGSTSFGAPRTGMPLNSSAALASLQSTTVFGSNTATPPSANNFSGFAQLASKDNDAATIFSTG